MYVGGDHSKVKGRKPYSWRFWTSKGAYDVVCEMDHGIAWQCMKGKIWRVVRRLNEVERECVMALVLWATGLAIPPSPTSSYFGERDRVEIRAVVPHYGTPRTPGALSPLLPL